MRTVKWQQRGFSLAEILVAIAILSTVGVTAFQILGKSARALTTLEKYSQMEVLANNLLARIQTELPLESTDGHDASSDFRWRIEVNDAEIEGVSRSQSALTLKTIRIEIYDDSTNRARSLSFTTQRLSQG